MLAINSLRAPISFCCLVLFSALAFAQSAELPPAPPEDRTSGWSATGPVTTGSPFCADFVMGTSKDLANVASLSETPPSTSAAIPRADAASRPKRHLAFPAACGR
jgi:hypothetical protein